MTIKEKFKKSIKYKFRITFFISILIGNILSIFMIEPYFSSKIKDILTRRYETVVEQLREDKDDEDKLNESLDIYEALSCKIQIEEDISNFEIDKNQMDILNKNGIIYLKACKYKVQAIK